MTVTADRNGILAGIVLFQPDRGDLQALIERIAPAVDRVVLVRNSPLEQGLEAELSSRFGDLIAFTGTGANLGIGAAHNEIARAASEAGASRFLLLDQDSLLDSDGVRRLDAALAGLKRAQHTPAAVGPRPITWDGVPYKTPPIAHAHTRREFPDLWPVQFLIASGSLIDVAAWRAVGPFRDDYFIDAIDIEWCLRAAKRGHSCWMAPEVTMSHRLGSGLVKIPFIPVVLARQPAQRVYTFIRNQLAMEPLPHVPWTWRARLALALPVHSIVRIASADDRGAMAKAVFRGWRDGLLGRLGPPPA